MSIPGFSSLPEDLVQDILASVGSGCGAAATTCRTLATCWRGVLASVPLTARYLIGRYGLASAARHIYTVLQHNQQFQSTGERLQDSVILGLLREVVKAGAEMDLHHALLLTQAARAGHSAVISELLALVPSSVFAPTRALIAAAEHGHRRVVRQLLAAGALPSAYQGAALTAAASRGDADVVYDLCTAGADATADNSMALRRAVQLGHSAAAAALLQYGADAQALCSAALLHACELRPRTAPTSKSDQATAASSPSECRKASSPTTTAAVCRDRNPFEHLSGSRGTGRESGSGDGGPRGIAVADEDQVLSLVQMLLRSGANARAHGRPALEAAACRGLLRVVVALLEAGADPAACNSCALVAASIQGHNEVVRLLLEAGADPWDVSPLAMCTAAERGHEAVVTNIREAQMTAGGVGAAGRAGGGVAAAAAAAAKGTAVGGASRRDLAACAAAFWTLQPNGSMGAVDGGDDGGGVGSGVAQLGPLGISMDAASLHAFMSHR